MKLMTFLLASFSLLAAPGLTHADEKAKDRTDYQKAVSALDLKVIRVDLPAEAMLDLCIPTSRRALGRFTEYDFEIIPGYHALSILAVDGRLKRAYEWSCTYKRTWFNGLSADDEKRYAQLYNETHVPPERCIGRWGWERPPMRLWMRGDLNSGDAPGK